MFDQDPNTGASSSIHPSPDVEIVGGGLEASVRELAKLVSAIEPKLGAVRDSLTAVVESSQALREVSVTWRESQRVTETQLRDLAQVMGEVLRGIQKRLDEVASQVDRLSAALL